MGGEVTNSQKQAIFMRLICRLVGEANRRGYEVTAADFYRDPRAPYGHPKSLHRQRMAADLNLFRNGEWLQTTEAHRELGEFWEALSSWWRWTGSQVARCGPDDDGATWIVCAWGGRFNDGNHYAIVHEGMK